MAIITVPGPISGRGYRINILGDTPTVDEQQRIDSFISQTEQGFQTDYEQRYGSLGYDEGSGLGNILGEIPKGLVRGGVGILETGALGAAALLPERLEDPTREAIRRTSYNLSPQADIGLEDNLVGTLSEGVGSFGGIVGATLIGGPGAGIGLAAAAGAGEASERARAADATVDERSLSAALGLIPGSFDFIPVSRLTRRLGLATTQGLKGSLGRILQQSGEEALQEAAQEVAQNLIAQGVYDPEQDALGGIGEAAALGGGVGAIVGALVELVLPGRRRGASAAAAAPVVPLAEAGVPPEAGAVDPLAEGPIAEEPFDDEQMLLPTGMEMRPAVAGDAFGALTQLQQTQETAFAQAEAFGVQRRILADAAKGKTAAESAKDLGDTIKDLTRNAARNERIQLRNEFVQQVRNRIGVPSAEDPVALSAWQANTTAFLGAEKKRSGPDVERTPAPQGTQLTPAEQAAVKDAVAPAPEAQIEEPAQATPVVAPVIASADAIAAEPEAAPEQLFTPAFMQSFGFSKGAAPTKAAENTSALGGKPLSDPGVQELLNKLTTNEFVPPERQEAIRAAMAPAPAPVVEPPVAPVAETPAPPPPAAPVVPLPDYGPMSGTIPGAALGTAGQTIPQGVRGTASAPVPSAAISTSAAQPNDSSALGAEIAARVRSAMSQAQQDFLGLNEVADRPDVTDSTDKSLILSLLTRRGAKTPEEKAAKKFFSKFTNPTEAMEEIASQSVLAPKTFDKRGDSPVASAFYAGMGQDAAMLAGKWALTRMSPPVRAAFRKARQDARMSGVRISVRGKRGADPVAQTQQALEAEAKQNDDILAGMPVTVGAVRGALAAGQAEDSAARALGATTLPPALQTPAPTGRDTTRLKGKTGFEVFLGDIYTKAEQEALSDADMMEIYDGWAYSKQQGFALKTDAATGLDRPILPSVRRLLIGGNLKGALEAIAATAESSGVARIARSLSRVTGTTKVELVNDLTAEDGSPASGKFDPATNTISLDVNTGLNFHTVLHEMTHAAVSTTLSKPGHPLTMQLKTLFTNTKPGLGAAYGTTNLQEFAAEVLASVKFRQSLAQLNERGKNISALDRVLHALSNYVRRLLGMNQRIMGSALSRGDEIIMGMLAPSPESRNSGALYMAHRKGTEKRLLSNLVNADTVEANKARMGRLTEILTDAGAEARLGTNSLFKEAVLRLTPLHYLVQVAEPYFPSAPRLNELVNEANGEIARVLERTTALNNKIGQWASGNRDLVDRFNALINYSTLYQVDPEITGAAALKAYGSDTDRMQQYRAVMADWNAVGPSGQAEYRGLRNVFRTLHADLMTALDARLESAIPDAQVRSRVRNDLYKQLTAKDQLSVYFALGRSGDYWLSYNAYDPRSGSVEYFVEAFETQTARARAQTELESDPATQAANFKQMLRLDSDGFANAPPASFVAKLNNQLRAANVDEDTVRLVTNLYLDTVPETSFLQSYRQRKGTLGFNKDAIHTNTTKANTLARNIVRLKYGSKFAALKSRFAGEAQQGGISETPKIKQLRDQLDAFADFGTNPDLPGWSQTLRSVAFNMTLGFNISTAMLNLMQMPMIGLPFLGAKYGYRETTRAMGAATRLIAGSGMMREIDAYNPDGTGLVRERVAAQPSLENYDFNSPDQSDEMKKLRYLVEVGRTNGQFNRSITFDIMDIDGTKAVSEKFNRATGWMLHHSERANREVALASSYFLELGRLEAAGTALTPDVMRNAAKQAVYLTEMINGGTAAASTPRIAQNGLGSVVFMYKRYGVSMYALLFDTAKRALKDQSPEAKMIAAKQLGGLLGATTLLSGVAGLPVFGVVALLYNLLFADDDEPRFESVVREGLGDGMYRGILDYTLGVSVAPRVGLADVLFREPMIDKDQSSLWTLAEVFGGPAVGTYMNLERGINDMASGEWQRGIESASPAALRYILRSGRYANEGSLTRAGDSIVEDIHPGHLLAQAIGFAPAEIVATQEVNSARKRFERGVVERRSALADRYEMALREGNREALRELMEDIAAYNEDHPYLAVDREFLASSMRSRDSTNERTFNGVSFNARLVNEVRARFTDYQG